MYIKKFTLTILCTFILAGCNVMIFPNEVDNDIDQTEESEIINIEAEENEENSIKDEDDTTASKEICEVGREYEHNAIKKVACICPDGYKFETVSTGFGPCPVETMSGCPTSTLKCVKS